jgi:hypothetical protein
MTTYSYRCPEHGPVDVRFAFGTAPRTWDCPLCAASMARLFTPPMLGLGPRPLVAAIDRAEKSRTEPEVVSAPAPAGRRLRPVPPALRGLPRP